MGAEDVWGPPAHLEGAPLGSCLGGSGKGQQVSGGGVLPPPNLHIVDAVRAGPGPVQPSEPPGHPHPAGPLTWRHISPPLGRVQTAEYRELRHWGFLKPLQPQAWVLRGSHAYTHLHACVNTL